MKVAFLTGGALSGGNTIVSGTTEHIKNNVFAGQNILDNGNVKAFASFAERNGAGDQLTKDILAGKEVASKPDLYRLGKSFRKATKNATAAERAYIADELAKQIENSFDVQAAPIQYAAADVANAVAKMYVGDELTASDMKRILSNDRMGLKAYAAMTGTDTVKARL